MEIQLTNATKKLCVIGDPVLHSKSPLIQNAMLRALGLDYIYLCQPVPRGQTARWLDCARLSGYAGFNATMPHKEALLPQMDVVDEDARLYGAVNTVRIKDGKVYGYNTDGRGFYRALADLDIQVPGKRVTILGAGGAAKAVALKLVQQGAARVAVCNRTPNRAGQLCVFAPDIMSPDSLDPAALARRAGETDLLINCTSLGMTGTDRQFEDLSFLDALPPSAPVCDLIYAPAETALLRRARLGGHPTMNGLGMLIYQAVFALEHFTDTAIDAAAMAALVRGVL